MNTLNIVILTDILLTVNTDILLTADIFWDEKNCTTDNVSSARE